jgi:hypothetical protein
LRRYAEADWPRAQLRERIAPLRRPSPCVFLSLRTDIAARAQKQGCDLRSLAGEHGRFLSKATVRNRA